MVWLSESRIKIHYQDMNREWDLQPWKDALLRGFCVGERTKAEILNKVVVVRPEENPSEDPKTYVSYD